MLDYKTEKELIRSFLADIDQIDNAGIAECFEKYCAENYRWRGFHPFNELNSPGDVAAEFWVPLKEALSAMGRRLDILMAGANTLDGDPGVWVASMGHLMGLFDKPWLGIPPTRKIAMLRYAEFHRVHEGKIVETAMYFDIPHLMMQAGLTPFAPQTAAHLVQPGPLTHDGVMHGPQPQEEGERTLAVIDRMVEDLREWRSDGGETLLEELRRSWCEDMIWWGPAGIGATGTIERYAEQHAGPFRTAFRDRRFNGHVAKIAEGAYGGFFGWPNLTLTLAGEFMGMSGNGKPGDMRVIDIYRRDGDKLAENWVFIDLLHFWLMQGVDVLGGMGAGPRK